MAKFKLFMMVICLLAIFVKAEQDSKIDLSLKTDDLETDYIRKNMRELRGRGGGRSSRYSGSRSYSRSSKWKYSKDYAATNNYKYAYSTYKNPTRYSNSYLSADR